MSRKAANDFVVIKPNIRERSAFESASDVANDMYKDGVVVMSGSMCQNPLEKGTRVMYNDRSAHTQVLNNETFRIVKERDIVLILDDNDIIG